jgi:DNA polymerase delta subunit 3
MLLKDLQMLSDVNREVQQLCISEDVLEFAPKYGTITNKNAKRRTSRRPPPPGAAPLPTKAGPLKPKTEVKEALKPAAKQENKSSQSSTAQDFFGKGKAKEKVKSTGSAPSSKESTPVPAAAAAPPALKRDNSSIFKSFAKAKPKLKREETDSSAAADSPAEDSPMKDVSDDEEETYVPPVVTEKDKEVLDTDRAARKAREAALKAMMDDSDEEEAPVLAKKETKAEKVEKDDVEMKEPTPAAPVVTDGRRRGRRRVMKKRTVKDEDGYLGMFLLLYSFTGIVFANQAQSRKRNQSGNLFQRTSQSRNRSQNHNHFPQQQSRRRGLRKLDRATSCRSLAKSD